MTVDGIISKFQGGEKAEPGAHQLNCCARGVGNVRIGWRSVDETQEELGLVDVVQLGPKDLAKVRAEVLELERRAYEISKDVYGHTPPMGRSP